MPTKNKIIKQLQSVLLLRDMVGGGNTTSTAAAAAGASTINATSATNFAAGDTIRIGSGDTLELAVIASIAALVFTLNDPLTYAHPTGDAIVEQTGYDLGDIGEGGVAVTLAGTSTQVPVSTKRLNYATLDGFIDYRAEFSLPGFAIHNLAFALGIALTEVSGNGATLTPFALVSDGNNFAGEQNQSLVVTGVRMDGTIVRMELWNVDFDYTSVTARLARGVLADIPVRAIASAGGVMSSTASSYVKNVTLRPTKGKVFDSLSEVGLFADETAGTPVNTTTSGANLAGQSVVNVVSGTNVVAGQWMRIGAAGSDTVEYHRVASVSVNAVTLVDRLLRDIPTGSVFRQQALIPFATVAADGVTFSIGGSIEILRAGTTPLSIGIKPGDAAPVISFAVLDISPENYARALGIPQAAIVGGRLPLNTNIGTSQIDGIYVKGLLQDGMQSWLVAWGCSQDISSIAFALSARGTPSLPLALRPASGFQLLQHS